MRWPLCTAFRAGTFKKDKCADCFHTVSDHGGAASAPASASSNVCLTG
jgi:hypothetical protein